MRSQCNSRWMGYGMTFDQMDDEDEPEKLVRSSALGCRLPNEDPSLWKELSGECVSVRRDTGCVELSGTPTAVQRKQT
jgi:hypothetical protein